MGKGEGRWRWLFPGGHRWAVGQPFGDRAPLQPCPESIAAQGAEGRWCPGSVPSQHWTDRVTANRRRTRAGGRDPQWGAHAAGEGPALGHCRYRAPPVRGHREPGPHMDDTETQGRTWEASRGDSGLGRTPQRAEDRGLVGGRGPVSKAEQGGARARVWVAGSSAGRGLPLGSTPRVTWGHPRSPPSHDLAEAVEG